MREPVRAFIRERIVPRESELIAAIDDEVAPGVAYPAAIRELRARGGLVEPVARRSLATS